MENTETNGLGQKINMALSAEGSNEENVDGVISKAMAMCAGEGRNVEHVTEEFASTDRDHVTLDAELKAKHVAESFTIDSENNKQEREVNLQDAFLRYKHKIQKELKKTNRKRKDVPDEMRLRAMADPDRMWQLRMKFLEQTKKYFGVPYARKYWKPEEPEYNGNLFLDCCGLVRRAMRDLKKDFGFKVGPWNQAYMYDTLPISIEREEDMKPGDLVFISGTYHNTKMKKQKHSLTHVEVWLGDGPKSIGARWHKGKVQIFDSYQFNSTAYHSMKYYFKSIDTWLMGICRSHCPDHVWKTRTEKFKPGEKSIFTLPAQDNEGEESDESAGDSSSQEQARVTSGDKPQKHQVDVDNTRSVLAAQKKSSKKPQPDRISKSAKPRLRDDRAQNGSDSSVRARPLTRAASQPQVLRGLGIQGRAFGQQGSRYDALSCDQPSVQSQLPTLSRHDPHVQPELPTLSRHDPQPELPTLSRHDTNIQPELPTLSRHDPQPELPTLSRHNPQPELQTLSRHDPHIQPELLTQSQHDPHVQPELRTLSRHVSHIQPELPTLSQYDSQVQPDVTSTQRSRTEIEILTEPKENNTNDKLVDQASELSGISQLVISDETQEKMSHVSIDQESLVGSQNVPPAESTVNSFSSPAGPSKKGVIVTQLEYVTSLTWVSSKGSRSSPEGSRPSSKGSRSSEESRSSSAKSSCHVDDLSSVAATEYLDDAGMNDRADTRQEISDVTETTEYIPDNE